VTPIRGGKETHGLYQFFFRTSHSDMLHELARSRSHDARRGARQRMEWPAACRLEQDLGSCARARSILRKLDEKGLVTRDT